jgi:aminopeptidase N
MRKYLLLILLLAITHANAQRNLCALGKQKSNQHKSVVSSSVQALEELYDVSFYHLDIDVEITGKYVSGNVRTIAKVLSSSLDTFAFELHANHSIDSMKINGQTTSYSRSGAAVYGLLPQTLSQNQFIDAVVYYHGTAPTSGSAAIDDGFNNKNSPSWGNTVTWSLSESYVAYEWWPCKQQLRDKADSSYCFITTDSTNKGGSNGILTAVVDLGNGKKRYEWKSHHAIDYYLISVAVAKYIDYSFYAHPAGGDSVFVQNYIYDNPNTLSNFQSVIDQTAELIEFFSDKYGLYFFNDEKYLG